MSFSDSVSAFCLLRDSSPSDNSTVTSPPPPTDVTAPSDPSDQGRAGSSAAVSTPAVVARVPVGRKPDAVSAQVDVDPEGGVWCKKCLLLIQTTGRTHVERVKHHVNKRCAHRPSSGLITDVFKPKLKSAVTKQFQERLAAWVFSTGMAFYKIDHPTLKQAIQLLNPDVELPTAKQLANSLLDHAYDASIRQMAASLSGKVATLVTDAWTDIRGFSVVNYMAVSGADTYFLESAYTGAQSHDTSFLSSDIERVVAKYAFMKVGAVVTDNTATNKAVWSTLQHKFPQTFFHGCVCHALHLLVKDVLASFKWLNALHDSCKLLVVFFKKNDKLWFELSSRLAAESHRNISRPANTRWGSLLDSCKTVLAAESILFSMVSARNFLDAKNKKQKKKRRAVHDLVRASDFVPHLQKAVRILSIIGKCIKIFEKNTTPVSDVYNIFLELPKLMEDVGLTASELKTMKRLIGERFEFISGDAHGLAYLLDPRYIGSEMDVGTRSGVEDFLSKWYGAEKADDVVLELARYPRFVRDFQERSPRQWSLIMKRQISVYDFWCGVTQFPLLQPVALRLFRCAASSAASERNFSTHAFIHSKLRNRLAPERVGKLVHVFFNAKNIGDDDLERYSELEDALRGSSDDEASDDERQGNQDEAFVYY